MLRFIKWKSVGVQAACIVGVLALVGTLILTYRPFDRSPSHVTSISASNQPNQQKQLGPPAPLMLPEIVLPVPTINDRDLDPYLVQVFQSLTNEVAQLRTSTEPVDRLFLEILADAGKAVHDKDYPTAARLLSALSVFGKSHAGVHVLLGICRIKLREFALAQKSLQAAVEISPENPLPRILRALAYFETKQFDLSISESSRCLELDPELASARVVLGAAYLEQGKNHATLAVLDNAVGLESFEAQRAELLHIAFARLGEYEQAKSFAARTLALSPRNVVARTNLCAILLELNSSPDAIAACKAAIEIDPKHASAHANLGVAYLRQEDFGNAISSFRRALDLDTENTGARDNLATALLLDGKVEDAIKEYRAILNVQPGEKSAYNMLGLIALQMGEFATSIRELERSLSIDNDQPEVLALLGLAKVMRGLTTDGIFCLQRAVARRPENGVIRYHLARALIRVGNEPEALSELEAALALEGRLRPYLKSDRWFEAISAAPRFLSLIADRDPIQSKARPRVDSPANAPLRNEVRPSQYTPAEILNRVTAVVENFRDLEAPIKVSHVDELNLHRTEKTGRVKILNHESTPLVFVMFDEVIVEDVLRGRAWYLFDGLRLFVAKEQTKTLVIREYESVDGLLDLFDADLLPIPMSLLYDRGMLFDQFDMEAGAVASDDRSTAHLVLTPKIGTKYRRMYDRLDLYFNMNSGLLSRAVMTSVNGLILDVFEFLDSPEMRLNDGTLSPADFRRLGEWEDYEETFEKVAENDTASPRE